VKYRWSSFYQTYLDLALRARGIDTLIISGGSTDVGVASTLYSGRDMDYNMIVASDACGTSHDQRAHDMLMELIFPRMARVRTTEQIIQMIEKARSK
jgi:nicotinamidase-related amidase